MSKAMRIHAYGGPEVLKWESVDIPKPGPGEVLLKQVAAGLNYIDVYHRTGLYPVSRFPATLGLEGAGIVEAKGEGANFFQTGDLVAYAGGPMGAYAEYRVIPEKQLVKVPAPLTGEQAAGIMLKGLTAHFLVNQTFRVFPGSYVLIHAAAGGVGLLLCQWAKHLGATVIGTAGSPEKMELARKHGCDHPLNYKDGDIVAKVREITGGKGVNVVYDSVGQATFMPSLDCLMPLGLMVSYGQSSGPVPPFDISLLNKKGSLFLTRPSMMAYKAEHSEYVISCTELFGLILKGTLKINIGQSYYLSDAANAHRDLEARKTTGSTILVMN